MGKYYEQKHEAKGPADALKEAFLAAFAVLSFMLLFYASGRLRICGASDAAISALCALPYAACVVYIIFAPSSVKRSVADARIARPADMLLFALATAAECASFYLIYRSLDSSAAAWAGFSTAVFLAALSVKMAYYKHVKFPRLAHTVSSLALYASGFLAAAFHPFFIHTLAEALWASI